MSEAKIPVIKMLERKKAKRKRIKPTIEEVVSNLPDYEVKTNILDFIAYLKKNKMHPIQASMNSWKITRKACVVCYLRVNLEAGTVQVQPILNEYRHDSLSDELKEIVWKNKKGACGTRCHNCSYKLKTIFGKEYKDACGNVVSFINPGIEEIECIKELLELRKSVIRNGKLMPLMPRNFGLS